MIDQEYISEQLGVPQSWTTKIERGEIRFGDPSRMRALAGLLRLDYDELVLLSGLVDRSQTAIELASKLPPAERERLNAAHRRLDPLLVSLTPRHIELLAQTAELWIAASDSDADAIAKQPIESGAELAETSIAT